MSAQDSIEIADATITDDVANNNDNAAVIAESSACSPSSSSTYSLTVSNGPRGHLARIKCVALFPMSPEAVFRVLTNPNNTGVFRDVLGSTRKVVSEEERREKDDKTTAFDLALPFLRRVVEVEQTGRVRLPLKGDVRFKTRLRVTEDATGAPKKWTTRFELLSSDVLSTFDGTWTLEPREEEEGGEGGEGEKKAKKKARKKTTMTVATLEQDVTPRCVPRWLKFVPLVGGGVKCACARAVRRMLEDLAAVADAVAAKEEEEGRGGGSGKAVEEVLRECQERAAREKEKEEEEKEKEEEEKEKEEKKEDEEFGAAAAAAAR